MNASWARCATVAILLGATILDESARIDAAELPKTTTSAPAETRTFATIIVNGEERNEQIVVLKPDGVYAALAGLRANGLVIPQRFAGGDINRYINVRELAPEIVALFDQNGPTLRLQARSVGSLSRSTTFSLAPEGQPALDALAAKSGYLNYSLRAGSAGLSGAQELTLSDGAKTLFSAGTFDAHGFHRSLTNLTWNSAPKRRRTMIGEVFGYSGDLGSALTLAGVGVARANDLDPSEQLRTSATLQGNVLSPSTADVYINGQLVRSLDVAPGAFDVRNLPGLSGVTDAKVVLRDAFGRVQELSTRYYGATSVLKRGETDYSYSAGAVRDAFAGASGTLAALGYYRLGVTETTTLGGHAEIAGGFENLGATFDHAGRLGTWGIAVAQSRDRDAAGVAAIMSYTTGTPNVWVDAAVRVATPAYTGLAERAFPDRTTRAQRLSIGFRPFRSSYTSTLSYGASRSRLGSAGRQLSWQQSLPLSGRLGLLLTTGIASDAGGSHRNFGVVLFGTVPRRSGTATLNASVQNEGSSVQSGLELQRAAPLGGGLGYDVTGYASGPTLSRGRFGMYSAIGDLDADYDVARGGTITGNVAVSGAIAMAGPHVHLSRPIADSFAIVNVVGGERAKVLLDNQAMGMTDGKGVLVLPALHSYHGQRVAIERDDGPVNLSLSNAYQNLVMASRHGGVATFSASVVTAVIGTVIVSRSAGIIVPAFGQLSLLVAGKSITSELDRDGHFYLENVTPGSYAAVILYGGGECRFTMNVPRTTGIEENIGEIACAAV